MVYGGYIEPRVILFAMNPVRGRGRKYWILYMKVEYMIINTISRHFVGPETATCL